jgi:hypothetical protein
MSARQHESRQQPKSAAQPQLSPRLTGHLTRDDAAEGTISPELGKDQCHVLTAKPKLLTPPRALSGASLGM